MARILTFFLVVHWAVVFSLLATLSVLGSDGGGLRFFGIDLPGADYLVVSVPVVAASVAMGFATCAVLFWWALVALFAGNDDGTIGEEVLRVAFAAAAGLMTLLLVVGTFRSSAGLFPAMAAHFAALIASYVAIRSEQQSAVQRAEALVDERLRLAARARAIGASQTVKLSRFAGAHDGQRSFER
ncbi:hypothetical protein [Kumtagia ephedrae]|jgi:hypothetical protein|uniref:Uncharacterized protein n=1 Tax=Kumtagia ephedrae TaxID=2116701 RepID=A0A2P7SH84_9HYPH|nr:hypothetical protein [Mesorhizobium ephedrae]PSJ61830.1 hypothetical protein C7I84_09535 [Mesorhizobium ephedrae]